MTREIKRIPLRVEALVLCSGRIENMELAVLDASQGLFAFPEGFNPDDADELFIDVIYPDASVSFRWNGSRWNEVPQEIRDKIVIRGRER